MPTTPFYPKLNRLISAPDLPDFLGFLQNPLGEAIDAIIGKFRYKDLIVCNSHEGDLTYYNLSILTSHKLGLEIPGTGLTLVLNPPPANFIPPTYDPDATSDYSEFNVSVFKRWEILKYLHDFQIDGFAHTAYAFFELIMEIFNIDEEDILNSIVENFVLPDYLILHPDTDLLDEYDHVQTLVDIINDTILLNIQPKLVLSDPSADFTGLLIDIKNYINQNPQVDFSFSKIADYFINYTNDTFENLEKIVKSFLGNFTIDRIKEIIIPVFNARLNEISFGIEFPRNVLLPVWDNLTNPNDPNNGKIIDEEILRNGILIDDNNPAPEEDEKLKTTLTFSVGALSVSTYNRLEFEEESEINFPKSQIMKTGLLLKVSDMKLDLSRTKNIPEATAAGYDDDFTGVFIKTAEIDLPQKWFKKQGGATLGVYGKNLLIGTGGISGTLGLMAVGGQEPPGESAELRFNFGKSVNSTPNPTDVFAIGFNCFDITFQQNAFVNSNFKGKFYIPTNILTYDSGNQVVIDIDVNFDADGDFHITAKAQEGIVFHIPKQDPSNPKDILSLTLKSLSVGKTEDRFYIEIAGKIDFNVVIPALGDCLPKGIDVEKLRIWEDGSMEFVGGVNLMPIPKEVKIGPVKISISSLSMGTHEQMYEGDMAQYRYFGFDGGVNVNPGGVDARVNGVKFYYNIDPPHDVFVRIEGIAIDLVLPGNCSKENAAVILSGFLSMKDPDPDVEDSTAGTEYAGGISISLPKLHIAGSAAMRLNPNKPAFIVDMGLELNTPIPLGSTGLGIYGFRGLVGEKYVADKVEAGVAEDASWYEYYKIPPEGICIDKFEQRNGFALGAGVSLATSSDSGKVFSSKLFFLLSLPDVFLLQGQAAILSKRIGLDTVEDPPFSAMIAITSQSVEAGFGINYRLPEEGDKLGKIVRVDGLIEMGFFFGDSSAWYVNIGRDAPPEKRIQARILDLFNAYFYLMLSSGGIKAGAGASFDFNKKFGPVEVFLGAYIDLAGHISFQPKQIGGSIDMGGYAGIKIFKFKLGFSIAASLAAEAPKPHVITGSVTLTINLPWPFDDINLKINFTWTFSNELNLEPLPLVTPVSDSSKIPFAKALNIHTKESFEVYCNEPIYVNSTTTIYLPDPGILDGFDPIPMDSYIDAELTKGVLPDFDNSVSVRRFGDKHGANYIEKFAPDKAASEQVRHDYWVTDVCRQTKLHHLRLKVNV